MPFEEITTEAGFREAFPVMNALRTHLDEDAYMALLAPMREQGYRLFAWRDDGGEIVALAGIGVRVNFYNGPHVYVYDLVTRPDSRSHGFGEKLLTAVEDFARQNNAPFIALTSGLQRLDAHRFYEERMGYARVSWAFTKRLDAP